MKIFDLEPVGTSEALHGYNPEKTIHAQIGYHYGRNEFLVEIQSINFKFFYHLGKSVDYVINKTNVELKFRGVDCEIVLTPQQKERLYSKLK